MKIVFNTNSPTAAASLFYQQAFQDIGQIDFYNSNFAAYDVALFMTYDYAVVEEVKKRHPHLKIGIIDPRAPAILSATPHCDFLIVDGVEMEDYWRIAQKPIFRYVEYPRFSLDKQATKAIQDFKLRLTQKNPDKIYIGYHGNSHHLMEGAKTLCPALTGLGKKYNIELLLMHNNPPPQFENQYKQSLPTGFKSTCVPWSMENYKRFLGVADIGIVPNNLGLSPKEPSTTGDPNTDYCLSFKMTSNPGRFIVFGLLGIPVVADFYPSSLQYLQNGCGFVAHSQAGWYHCLEKLIISSTLRKEMGNKLQSLVQKEFDFKVQNEKLICFLETIV